MTSTINLELDFEVLARTSCRLRPFLVKKQCRKRRRQEFGGGAPDRRRKVDSQNIDDASSSSSSFEVATPSSYGSTIDWHDPSAQRALSAAILEVNFGVAGWDVPANRLCPPIPNRFEYVSWVRDLLALDEETARAPLPAESASDLSSS